MDVGNWLRSLGLGQYETLFRQNDIDAEDALLFVKRRFAWR